VKRSAIDLPCGSDSLPSYLYIADRFTDSSVCGYLLTLFPRSQILLPWRWRDTILRNVGILLKYLLEPLVWEISPSLNPPPRRHNTRAVTWVELNISAVRWLMYTSQLARPLGGQWLPLSLAEYVYKLNDWDPVVWLIRGLSFPFHNLYNYISNRSHFYAYSPCVLK
jgi:hypothetical protein